MAVVVPRPLTDAATICGNSVPSPSWPNELSPQHMPAPLTTAHVCLLPPATELTGPLMPTGSVGDARPTCVPSPSWPAAFPPQHSIPCPAVSAHDCVPPNATDTNAARPTTSTASGRCVTEPSPSWPLLLSPQHATPPA